MLRVDNGRLGGRVTWVMILALLVHGLIAFLDIPMSELNGRHDMTRYDRGLEITS